MTSSIPKSLVPVLLQKAGQLYETSKDGYSLDELKVAAAEVDIPPEMVEQAFEQLKREQILLQRQKEERRLRRKRFRFVVATMAMMTFVWVGAIYNGLTQSRNQVRGRWAQVENQLQRRADLIPKLTQLAESFAETELQVIQALTQAQQSFVQAQTVEEKQRADDAMKDAIADFQLVAVRSPQLQSSQLFINLQFEMAGTENRIATERMRYNQAVETYNDAVQKFPTILIAKSFGFAKESDYLSFED